MRTDRWTDMTKVTVAFNNLAKAPKNVVWQTRTNVSDRHMGLNTKTVHCSNKVLPMHVANHTVTESSKCHSILG